MFNHISQNNDGGVSHFHTIALNSSADKVIRENAPVVTQVQPGARRRKDRMRIVEQRRYGWRVNRSVRLWYNAKSIDLQIYRH